MLIRPWIVPNEAGKQICGKGADDRTTRAITQAKHTAY